MLGIFVKFVILLVARRTLKNTSPTYVSLMIMKFYLVMKRLFIVTMIQKKIKEFAAFKGAYEVASLIEKYDITLYESENFDILKYCYENYAHNVYVKEFLERMTVALEENNDMHESIDNDDSDDLIEISLDEHDACYSCGHDANIYEDEFVIVPYVKMRSFLLHPYLIVPSMKSMIAIMLS